MTFRSSTVPEDEFRRVLTAARILADADHRFADGVYATMAWLAGIGPEPDLLGKAIEEEGKD